MSAPEDDEETAGDYRGVVIIEWPAPYGVPPYSALIGRACTVTDAVTGKPILTCTRVVVRASMDEIVTADLTVLADADGNPLLDGEPVVAPCGREFLTGTFPFAVSEMRVRNAG